MSQKSAAALEDEEWYHGLLPREDINRMLTKQGQFLVRKTEVEGKVKHVLSVCWHGRPRHVVLHQNERKRHMIDPNCKDFDNIPALVQYYMTSKTPLPRVGYVLHTPVPRQDWELRHEQITLDKKLGEGAFGEVYKGWLKKTDEPPFAVAIKRSHESTQLSKEQIAEIVAESRIMQKFNHPNIVRLWGVAAEQQPIMLVMELVNGGALDSYLQKEGAHVSQTIKTKFCYDGAKGMEYLHSKRCIHRDIAARNCLRTTDNVVKISDFGLSQEGTSFKMTKNMKVPIRWLAPETMSTQTYTFKTDIWAFGVMMWEIYHDGQEPYPGMRVIEVATEVRNGYKMRIDDDAIPMPVRTMMRLMWETEPSQRPSFHDIRPQLQEIYQSMGGAERSDAFSSEKY